MKQLQIDFESAAATGAHALFLQFVARAEAYGYEKYRCCTEVLRYDATLHKGDNTIYLHPAPIWNSTHFQTGVGEQLKVPIHTENGIECLLFTSGYNEKHEVTWILEL